MAAKKPLTAGRISKLAANPGTRAALADKFLSPAQLRQRQMNARLDAPVVDGSSMTNRDLAHQTKAASTLQFGGDPVALAQQEAKDKSGWYQQYQDQVAKLRGDIANNAAQANTAAQGLTSAVGQLGAQTAVGTGDVRADADKGSAIRQALSASLGATVAAKGSNANDYAANLADVVVPGQKLTAQNAGAAGVRSARDQLAAFVQKYRGDAIGAESTAAADKAKMDLAYKTLGISQQNADTSKQNADTTSARADSSIAHAGDANKRWSASTNKYGVTNGAWASWGKSDAGKQKRQAAIDTYNKTAHPGKTPKSPYLGTSGQTGFKNDLSSTRSLVAKYKGQYTRQELATILTSPEGRPAHTVFIDPKTRKPILVNGVPVTDLSSAKKQKADAVSLTIPAIPHVSNSAAISAALDEIYDGHLSPATIKKLHDAGIKVNPLGISTKRPAKRVSSSVSRTSNPPVFSSGGVSPLGPVGVQ